MSEEIIHVKNLTKVYGGKTSALQGINASIDRGDWTSMIGPSGSGKTTLLNMIGCLDSPTEGTVIIKGTEITVLKQAELTRFRRENIGLIFQQHHLIPYLNALENVMVAQYYYGRVDGEKARESLEKVGLKHRLYHRPSQLSGGEQQRVCIARALINEPEIIIADEPTGNLDYKNGQVVLNLIKELHEEGHTIVLVTHNPDIAELGNRILRIADGKIEKGNL
ncbi:MAG: ABC transporter ATP-binding protein [Candidatus Odinarchaeota archaeon]